MWGLNKKRNKTAKRMKKFSRRRLRKLAGISDKLRFQKLMDKPYRRSKILVGLRYDLEWDIRIEIRYVNMLLNVGKMWLPPAQLLGAALIRAARDIKRRRKLSRLAPGREWYADRSFLKFIKKNILSRRAVKRHTTYSKRRPRHLTERRLVSLYLKLGKLPVHRRRLRRKGRKFTYSSVFAKYRCLKYKDVDEAWKKYREYTRRKKQRYLRQIIKNRYRWFYRPKLKLFKLFRKRFKRRFSKYRRIAKNRLFLSRLRSHFPKLTGYSEKGLMRLWLPIRNSYTKHWGPSNAVHRFSQAVLLLPNYLSVFLRLAPSLPAGKLLVKSGAILVNGSLTNLFKQLVPGDIAQINVVAIGAVQVMFSYQKWGRKFSYATQYLPFIQTDYSAMMFMLLRWPDKYELIAPSYLTERWIRRYVRQFPARARKYRMATSNWNFYKEIQPKRA